MSDYPPPNPLPPPLPIFNEINWETAPIGSGTGVQGKQGPNGIAGRQGNQGISNNGGAIGVQGFQGPGMSVASLLFKANESVAQGTLYNYTPIVFDAGTTVYDPFNFHSEIVDNTRITPSIAGWYHVSANASAPSIATGIKCVVILHNGVAIEAKQFLMPSLTGSPEIGGTGDQLLFANGLTDYFELGVLHNSGGTLSYRCQLSVHLVIRT